MDLYLRRPQQSLPLPRTSSVAQNDECVANVTCLKHSGPVVASRGLISFPLASRAPDSESLDTFAHRPKLVPSLFPSLLLHSTSSEGPHVVLLKLGQYRLNLSGIAKVASLHPWQFTDGSVMLELALSDSPLISIGIAPPRALNSYG